MPLKNIDFFFHDVKWPLVLPLAQPTVGEEAQLLGGERE